jgi:hypothetical protein
MKSFVAIASALLFAVACNTTTPKELVADPADGRAALIASCQADTPESKTGACMADVYADKLETELYPRMAEANKVSGSDMPITDITGDEENQVMAIIFKTMETCPQPMGGA